MTATTVRPELRQRFQKLAAQWKDESQFLSNSVQMAMLDSYQKIIGMGPDVLPCILQELRRETDHWFWALGKNFDIEHDAPDVLEGPLYGTVLQIMKRPAS